MTAVGQRDEFLDGRWYEHPVTGARLESVTKACGATNAKDWLADWSLGIGATWMVAHAQLIATTIAEAGPDAAVDLIKGSARRKRERARKLGSDVHHVIEALLLDAPLPEFEELDDEQKAEIDNVAIGFLNFLQDHDVRDADIEMSETTVADPVLGVAGTLDLLIRLRSFGLTLIDAKSGSHLDKEMGAQLAQYRAMTEVWLPTGIVRRMPKVDTCAILHLRPEFERGYKLIRVPDEYLNECLEWFHQMLAQYKTGLAMRKLPLRVLYPPLPDGSQPPPMLEDVDGHKRLCNVLIAAGFKRLDEVCGKTTADLLNLEGFGKKSVDELHAMLAEHDLTLDGKPALSVVA